MKHFRALILIVLSALLPVRGLMAATLLCPDSEGQGMVMRAAPSKPTGTADMPAHALPSPGQAAPTGQKALHHHGGEGASSDAASPAGHPATCHFCASGCCMASMVGNWPGFDQPSLVSTVALPAPAARVVSLPSSGPDRPPRSL